jgi:hypothetical protein
MINIDKAYCHQAECIFTIYQVRDQHFDEDTAFHAKKATYECADEDCQVPLVGVNDTKVEFKVAPHFRIKKGHEHSDGCDSKKPLPSARQLGETPQEPDTNVSEYPNVLHLEPQVIRNGTGKPTKYKAPKNLSDATNAATTDRKSTPKNETSSLEHIVETWLEHGKEGLSRVLLTIGDQKRYYPNAFKPIQWFYRDPPGRIYWGHVKSIRKYGDNYAITLVEQARYEGESRQVGIYITEEQIQGYRKRRLFRHYLDALVGCEEGKVQCYFVGAYPELKDEDVIIKTPQGEKSFRPLEVKLVNLDHIVLRFQEDGADI